MGYSEAALAGAKDNGRTWKYKTDTVVKSLEILEKAVEDHDLETANATMKVIGAAFRPIMDKIGIPEYSTGYTDALEYFENDTLDFEFDNWELEEIQQHINYHMNELYDFADYHRIWVA